jgi:16S rRNA (cytidine1402-2'-O)-methyltransferase
VDSATVTSPGTLFIVATPLGHLGDLSPRAAEVLRAVDVVAAEDTRRTRPLLAHAGAHARLISYHAHSTADRRDTVLEILHQGRDVALVSDAGTPGISDPGAALVAAVRSAGLRIIPVPGPSAVATALSAAGFSADRFLFLGFLPRKGKERARLLRQAADSEWTVVLYEAPLRVAELLADLRVTAGPERKAILARELTKLHEEILSGSLEELSVRVEAVEPRGECTLVLEGSSRAAPDAGAGEEAARVLTARLLEAGHSRRDVARLVSEALGVPRNVAYRLAGEAT